MCLGGFAQKPSDTQPSQMEKLDRGVHTCRMGICWQNVAYNQPPHLGYYLPDFIDSFQGNDPSTGIVEIEKMRNVDNEIIYNLQGQRVKNVSHGIFVRGGKKFMVK